MVLGVIHMHRITIYLCGANAKRRALSSTASLADLAILRDPSRVSTI
jgi:hypothetical protein